MEKEDVHIRVSAEIMKEVRAYAKRRGLTLAAAIAVLLNSALREEL